MGRLIYKIFIKIYFLAIAASALFSSKARLFIKGRRHLFSKLQEEIAKKPGDYIWIHCASLGEFEQGRPVIEEIKKEFPAYKIALTFFSPSGFEIRKNYQYADLVYYLPEDTWANAKKFLDLLNPKLIIFIKYEFWYYFSSEIKKRNIPFLSVSSIFRENQIYFKSYGKFYRNILRNFSHFFVQDENSLVLLKTIGISNVSVAGDSRFDRVLELNRSVKSLPEVKDFVKGHKVFIAGSIWHQDLQVIAPLLKSHPHFKFIIAPHEIEETIINKIVKGMPSSSRYSKGINITDQVLIIDNIGLLSSLYQFADYAFIGGAYGNGLHNILEAATFGMPVFFGNKNYKKFNEAVNLVKQGGAFPVADYKTLKGIVDELESQNWQKDHVDEISKSFVIDNTGATGFILGYIKELLKNNNGRKSL